MAWTSYYFLYGENVTAFPQNFRMLAGDPFQRDFTWPIPDPPKSLWSGVQESQAALRQKALGFNCLNYAQPPEPSLYRHFMPNKTYLDEHCTDGLRLELMFPSCWNGKDVDSPDHKSHVAYPSLVMDGTCPQGYEARLVSLFFETIWNTYAFKDTEGFFALADGDPTGFGYHGDFMQGWEHGVLQQAIDTCTSDTGIVDNCEIFDLQSEAEQRHCWLDLPPQLQYENVHMHADGLPGNVPIEWGPAYALPPGLSSNPSTTTLVPDIPTLSVPTLSIGLSVDPHTLDILHSNEDPRTTSFLTATSALTPTSTSLAVDPVTQEIFYMEEDIVVLVNDKGTPCSTSSTIRTVSSATTFATQTSTLVFYSERDDTDAEPPHVHKHAHHPHGHLHHKRDLF